MGIRKHGTGEILRDEDEQKQQKAAAANWTDKDREELEAELAEDESDD